jgi:hypothetical protein
LGAGEILVADVGGLAVDGAVREATRAGLEREQNTMRKIAQGQTTAELLGIPQPENIG